MIEELSKWHNVYYNMVNMNLIWVYKWYQTCLCNVDNWVYCYRKHISQKKCNWTHHSVHAACTLKFQPKNSVVYSTPCAINQGFFLAEKIIQWPNSLDSGDGIGVWSLLKFVMSSACCLHSTILYLVIKHRAKLTWCA